MKFRSMNAWLSLVSLNLVVGLCAHADCPEVFLQGGTPSQSQVMGLTGNGAKDIFLALSAITQRMQTADSQTPGYWELKERVVSTMRVGDEVQERSTIQWGSIILEKTVRSRAGRPSIETFRVVLDFANKEEIKNFQGLLLRLQRYGKFQLSADVNNHLIRALLAPESREANDTAKVNEAPKNDFVITGGNAASLYWKFQKMGYGIEEVSTGGGNGVTSGASYGFSWNGISFTRFETIYHQKDGLSVSKYRVSFDEATPEAIYEFQNIMASGTGGEPGYSYERRQSSNPAYNTDVLSEIEKAWWAAKKKTENQGRARAREDNVSTSKKSSFWGRLRFW